MKKKCIIWIFILCTLIITRTNAYPQSAPYLRDVVIARTLDIIQTRINLSSSPSRSSYREPGYNYQKTEQNYDLNDPVRYLLGKRGYLTVDLVTGYIKGNTTYHISFDNAYAVGGHGESELEWPLDNSLLGLQASLNYRLKGDNTRDRARLGFAWFARRIDKQAGKMEDSDWIENDAGFIDYYDDGILNGSSAWAVNNSGKDVYSESVAKLDDINIWDISYIYNFWLDDRLAVAPKIGYRDQKFNFSSYDLDQIGYPPYGPDGSYDLSYRDTRGLKWLTYQAHYRIPYFGLESELRREKDLSLFLSFAYSPWVRIKDADVHLYPTSDEATGINHDMLSEGRCDGQVYIWGLKGVWRMLPDCSLNLGASYYDLEAKGQMTQKHYYDSVLYSVSQPIGERITSEYWLVDLSLRFIF